MYCGVKKKSPASVKSDCAIVPRNFPSKAQVQAKFTGTLSPCHQYYPKYVSPHFYS